MWMARTHATTCHIYNILESISYNLITVFSKKSCARNINMLSTTNNQCCGNVLHPRLENALPALYRTSSARSTSVMWWHNKHNAHVLTQCNMYRIPPAPAWPEQRWACALGATRRTADTAARMP